MFTFPEIVIGVLFLLLLIIVLIIKFGNTNNDELNEVEKHLQKKEKQCWKFDEYETHMMGKAEEYETLLQKSEDKSQ